METLTLFLGVMGLVAAFLVIGALAMPFVAHWLNRYWDWADRILERD